MNFCLNLEYFGNLNFSDISNNKQFMKTITNNGINPDKFLLVEKDKILSNEKVLANAFNNFFINTTSVLGVKDYDTRSTFFENLESLLRIFKDNYGIKRIKT